jgi:hypothetical protein
MLQAAMGRHAMHYAAEWQAVFGLPVCRTTALSTHQWNTDALGIRQWGRSCTVQRGALVSLGLPSHESSINLASLMAYTW